MAFNHYAKIKRILSTQEDGWFIKLIPEPTSAKNFKGETIKYDYYYRIYNKENQPIKFCKFQKIELLASSLGTQVENLPVTQ